MGRIVEALAARVEEGAACLAAFAAGLSEGEWETPASSTDTRTIGQIVNHVALVYPVEIDLARAIADGEPVEQVNAAAIAELNARHARQHPDDPREVVLELLRTNSREAADAVRTFTEEELSRTGRPGLYHGAPVTVQFVLEDHAVRHSWHHLARIRATLGR